MDVDFTQKCCDVVYDPSDDSHDEINDLPDDFPDRLPYSFRGYPCQVFKRGPGQMPGPIGVRQGGQCIELVHGDGVRRLVEDDRSRHYGRLRLPGQMKHKSHGYCSFLL